MDDDELEFDEQPFEVVQTYVTEREALVDARVLVERGIGANVSAVPTDQLAELAASTGSTAADGGEPALGKGAAPGSGDEPGSAPPAALADRTFRIEVLPQDLRRAQEALELVDPEARPEANPDEPMELEKAPVPWKRVLLIWLLALIILPLVAFLLTYTVMTR